MDIRTIEYYWNDDIRHTYTADVVVGDDSVIFDDQYPDYDERIFFYFQNEEEFENTFEGQPGNDGIEFTITRMEN